MKNLIALMSTLIILVSCQNNSSENSQLTQTDGNFLEQLSPKDSLCRELNKLKKCELNFDSLYSAYTANKPSDNYLKRDRNFWLFSKFSDTSRFDRADDIKPMCRLFENRNIVSIAFTDDYDYKQAIHIINFKKPDFEPKSSFILYSIGGDAEDFWNRDAIKITDVKYRVTDASGYYNDIETMDTIYYNRKTITEIEIDTINAMLTKKVLDDKFNFYKLNK